MSEDSGFIDKKKQQMKASPLEGVSTYAPQGTRVRGVENPQGFGIDERRSGLDLFGSFGNSSGLTPLSFDADVTTERTENTEILKNSSGLSPLRPFGEIHKKNMKSDYSGEGLSTSDGTDILGNSSGLTPLHSGSENFKRRVIK